jgi:hypothetical protein
VLSLSLPSLHPLCDCAMTNCNGQTDAVLGSLVKREKLIIDTDPGIGEFPVSRSLCVPPFGCRENVEKATTSTRIFKASDALLFPFFFFLGVLTGGGGLNVSRSLAREIFR